MASNMKPITLQDLQCLRPGDRVKWLINGGIEGAFVQPHGKAGIEWTRDDTGKSHYSPIHLMTQLNIEEEQAKADRKTDRANNINMCMAFELGYKSREEGHNLQASLARFADLLREEAGDDTINPC